MKRCDCLINGVPHSDIISHFITTFDSAVP